MKKIVVLFGIAIFILTGGSAATASLIENGDFESGLSGWDHSSNVKAKGSWANIDPINGNGERQAVMSPFGFLPSSLNQRFEAEDHISISFDYNFWSFSSLESESLEVGDDLVVSLSDDSAFFDEIFRVNFKDTFCNGPTIQGWQHYEETFQFETPMQLSLLFEVDNFKDPGQFGIGFIDNVELSSVPIPGAIYLLGSGLVGLIGIRRRNS